MYSHCHKNSHHCTVLYVYNHLIHGTYLLSCSFSQFLFKGYVNWVSSIEAAHSFQKREKTSPKRPVKGVKCMSLTCLVNKFYTKWVERENCVIKTCTVCGWVFSGMFNIPLLRKVLLKDFFFVEEGKGDQNLQPYFLSLTWYYRVLVGKQALLLYCASLVQERNAKAK